MSASSTKLHTAQKNTRVTSQKVTEHQPKTNHNVSQVIIKMNKSTSFSFKSSFQR